MNTVHIVCKVLPGLFENEYYVMVNGSAAYYVNEANIVHLDGKPEPGKPVDGIVRGYLVEREGEKALVQLPGEAVVGGVRTWVEHDAVTTAA